MERSSATVTATSGVWTLEMSEHHWPKSTDGVESILTELQKTDAEHVWSSLAGQSTTYLQARTLPCSLGELLLPSVHLAKALRGVQTQNQEALEKTGLDWLAQHHLLTSHGCLANDHEALKNAALRLRKCTRPDRMLKGWSRL